jgi:hypothetical protein
MDKQILKIQIESDLDSLMKDINIGAFDRYPEEYIKEVDRIWTKISVFIDALQEESDKALSTLKETLSPKTTEEGEIKVGENQIKMFQ